MTSLTFYGGVDEIGGNKILLDNGSSRIFLDFGMSFTQAGKYFDEFLQPRCLNGLGDYLITGLIPAVKGLYRSDLQVQSFDLDTGQPTIDAILLSHGHIDHCAFISLCDPNVPVHMTCLTRYILDTLQSTGVSGLESEFLEISVREQRANRYQKKPRRICTHSSGESFKVGDFNVSVHGVDHSIPGAAGYIVRASDAVIVYTGDIRLHGTHSDLTKNFVEKAAASKPDVLIIEGTNIKEEKRDSEADVENKVLSFLKNEPISEKAVFTVFPARDVDRLNTFFRISNSLRRKLVLSLKQAYLLDLLENEREYPSPSLDNGDFLVHIPRKKWPMIDEAAYYLWERRYISHQNSVTSEDINKHPAEFLVYLDFYSLKELIDICPPAGSYYIHSKSEPFSEDMMLDDKLLNNWLELFKLIRFQAHASGHASGREIAEAMDAIKPKLVFPVHTEHPESFRGLAQNVILPEIGKQYLLN
ncbi:MAG: MBL fold metallo-hydrolase [Actinobacteria bacterium]|nr:MBL fold metallo-hydrolase [Actinomycetota bacterium]